MAKGPSFDFERRERQKAKDAKRADKTQKKSGKTSADALNRTDGAIEEHEQSIAVENLNSSNDE